MLKSVIFDMDGVVVDSHPIHKKAWRRFLESLGQPVSDHELDFVLDGRKRDDILRHFLGDLSSEQVVEYGHRKEMLFREEALEIKMVEGVFEILHNLQRHGITTALASSGSSMRVRYILQQLQLEDVFQVVVTGDDVKAGKPDPTIFRLAAQQLNSAPSESLVVEDAVAGVQAAKAAGMKCVAVASNGRGKLLREAGADSVIPDFVGLTIQSLRDVC